MRGVIVLLLIAGVTTSGCAAPREPKPSFCDENPGRCAVAYDRILLKRGLSGDTGALSAWATLNQRSWNVQ